MLKIDNGGIILPMSNETPDLDPKVANYLEKGLINRRQAELGGFVTPSLAEVRKVLKDIPDIEDGQVPKSEAKTEDDGAIPGNPNIRLGLWKNDA